MFFLYGGMCFYWTIHTDQKFKLLFADNLQHFHLQSPFTPIVWREQCKHSVKHLLLCFNDESRSC